MKQARCILAVAVVLSVAVMLASCASLPGAQPQFKATLTAAPGVQSSALGEVTFRLSPDGQSLIYTLSVTNLKDVIMAHIHISSAPGQPGDVGVWLYPPKAPPKLKAGTFTGVLSKGTITAANFEGPLAGMTMADLVNRIKTGLAYVNVHTSACPDGEIQGTIRAAATS